MENYWGKHLVLEASGCDLDKMSDEANVAAFNKYLVEAIDMKQHSKEFIATFGHGELFGITLLTPISTSNIAGHFANDLKTIFLDVFSCKDFDEKVVLDVMTKFFGATTFDYQVLLRGDLKKLRAAM